MFVFALPWLSLVLSTLALQLLGAAWFMAVVPKPYALALGRADLGPPAPISIVGRLVCGAVVSATNAILLGSLHVTAQADALLLLRYLDRAGTCSERTVWPLLVGYLEGARSLVAWCELRAAFRIFRTDRMRSVEFLRERYPEPRTVLRRRWEATLRGG